MELYSIIDLVQKDTLCTSKYQMIKIRITFFVSCRKIHPKENETSFLDLEVIKKSLQSFKM